MDIKRVRRFGESFAHPLVVLIGLPNNAEHSRFAVSAGRSVGNAVERNRAKRLIRAALRNLLPSIKDGWDFVILARRPLTSANCQKTQKALESLFAKARFLK
ncbi:MAG: Ribonuclease P protein component [Chloroflexi bacterium]|nr:Ribonuclease P protein component [Chloroflexota bacterium]